MNEFDAIATFFAPLATAPGALRLTDDAALVNLPPGCTLVTTTDTVVEGVHFIGNEPPARIAQKLLRVNLSDLAAMGASPYGYLLNLSLPAGTTDDWLLEFAGGLAEDQARYTFALLGGDTTHTPGALTLSATALGLVPQGAELTRSGANAGDAIYVSGTLGDAALGLSVARQKKANSPQEAYLLTRYQLPEPRLALGEKLRGLASACMDISDGLAQDLGHIARASNLAAHIQWEYLPLSIAARAFDPQTLQIAALTGGDDYELLFTVPANAQSGLQALSSALALPLTRIGSMQAGAGVHITNKSGTPVTLPSTGYRHF